MSQYTQLLEEIERIKERFLSELKEVMEKVSTCIDDNRLNPKDLKFSGPKITDDKYVSVYDKKAMGIVDLMEFCEEIEIPIPPYKLYNVVKLNSSYSWIIHTFVDNNDIILEPQKKIDYSDESNSIAE